MAALLALSSVAFPPPLHAGTEAAAAPPPTPLRRDFEEAHAAQARYDMPGFFSLVRSCRKLAFAKHKMLPAKICDDAMFGAAQRLGDARAMVEADYWWQQHGFSAADKTSKAYSAFRKANLARLVDTVPPFSATGAGDPAVLKYQHRIEFSGRVAAEPLASHRPTVTATINGKAVAVVVDTGTVLPLMMDQAHATALGAKPILGGWIAPGMKKHPLPGARGFSTDVIASFKFGSMVMHNVATAVVPDGTFHVGVLVGLPVLARFGRVDLNDARIATGSAVPHCASGVPLRFVGVGQLGFSTIANGRPVTAMVDTGSMYALFARQGASPGSSSANRTDLGKSPGASRTRQRSVGVRLGTWSVTGIDMPDAKISLPPRVDVSIGAPLLAFADVRFDFSKPSLCVSPKPSVKDGLVLVYGNRREKTTTKDPVAILVRVLEDFLTKMAPAGATHEGKAAPAQ